MATANTTGAGQATSDAEFRAWGSWISGNISTFGWVLVSDSGDLDWGTITKAGAANTSQGYEIWRMNDALQATVPIFMKLEYGSANSTANSLGFWLTIGKGSDGAGTITNVIWSRRQIGHNGPTATVLASYMSGTSNRLQMALFSGGSAEVLRTIILSIERTVDANGAATGTGVYVICNQGIQTASAIGCCYGDYATGDKGYETTIGALFPKQGTGSNGSDIALYPIFYNKAGGPFLNPAIGAICSFTSNVTLNTTYTVTMYGTTMTFIGCGDSCGNTGANNWVRGVTANRVGLDLRYE